MTIRIAFLGAGAVGCTIAAHIYPSPNNDITLFARGEHLKALQDHGLSFSHNGKIQSLPINAVSTDEIGPSSKPYDVIFITVKSHQLPSIAHHIPHMSHTNSLIIPICNGIPWWFLRGLETRGVMLPQTALPSLDPDGLLAHHIALERLISGVTYMGATVTHPGQISLKGNASLTLGSPLPHAPKNTQDKLNSIFQESTLTYSYSDNIYHTILKKLCWNIAFNCLSVLYQKNSGELASDPEVTQRATALMQELGEIAKALQIELDPTPAKNIDIARNMGSFKPSMLQDYEAGKRLELDAILFSALHISELINMKSPEIQLLANDMKSFT